MRIPTVLIHSSFAFCLAVVHGACGGGGTNFDSFETALDSPSGSITETDTVIAADEKRQTTSSITDVGGFVSFAAPTNANQLRSSLIMRSMRPFTDAVAEFGGKPSLAYQPQELGDPGDGLDLADDCFDDLFDDPSNISVSENKISGKFSSSKNVADCSATGTGTMEITVSFTVKGNLQSETIDSLKVDGKITFVDVCENVDENGCVNGVVNIGARLADANLEAIILLSTWDLVVTWNEGGARQSVNVSGGLRVDINDSQAKIELLVEANNEAGESVSYTFAVESTPGAPFECRGFDGTATCTVSQEDNSVSCTVEGGTPITWTQEDIDRVTEDPSTL